MSPRRPRPRVTVIVPVFDQAAFLATALRSLVEQTERSWELVVVDDGSTDDLDGALEPFSAIGARHERHRTNLGLGAACNTGLRLARAEIVAYLPADDRWQEEHLQTVLVALDGAPDAVLAHAGPPLGRTLQLAQVAHRRTADRWTERPELESDDLDLLFWGRLRQRGDVVDTGRSTAVWTDHSRQRHKAILESHDGGLNTFRARYRVRQPLRFHSSETGFVDEIERYRTFRTVRRPARRGMRILLVGELAYNPERVIAFVERGHVLGGLWIADPLGFNSVGPMPFGHVEELVDGNGADWREAIRRWRPDVVYALLNWRAVPLAHAVRRTVAGGVRFVWHFKEAPQRCQRRGTWPQLAELHALGDAVIYSTDEERRWFELTLPDGRHPDTTHVLDGDLPSAAWFTPERTERMSDSTAGVHTAVVGRPAGLDASVVAGLAHADVHLHVYGAPASWTRMASAAAPAHVHRHDPVGPQRWVAELSRYDAGWLHLTPSANDGDLRRASWDDLNLPARVPTLLAAGLPLLHAAPGSSTVAVARVAARDGVGIPVDVGPDGVTGRAVATLAERLHDRSSLRAVADRAWAVRTGFTFDAHVDRLIGVLAGDR